MGPTARTREAIGEPLMSGDPLLPSTAVKLSQVERPAKTGRSGFNSPHGTAESGSLPGDASRTSGSIPWLWRGACGGRS